MLICYTDDILDEIPNPLIRGMVGQLRKEADYLQLKHVAEVPAFLALNREDIDPGYDGFLREARLERYEARKEVG